MNLAKVRGVLTCLLFLLPPIANAQAERFVEGVHYRRLADESVAYDLGAPEGTQSVLEIFWFGCGHCYAFDPLLNHWVESKPDTVQFARTPVIWDGNTQEHARLFYTARALGVLDAMHARIFTEIHEKHNYLLDEESEAALFGDFGVDPARFKQAHASFAVDTDVRKTAAVLGELAIPGVPALIVNGKYLINIQGPVDSHQALLDVADFLLNKES
jgi:protein dithiol oxidoreductase (disulfide-forming)